MIYLPYVDGLLEQATLDCVKHACLPFQLVEMRKENDYSNWLWHRWEIQRETIIVEHDIVLTTGQLEDLLRHKGDWRGYHYELPPFGDYLGLGCVAFGAALMKRNPNAMVETMRWRDEWHKPGHWCRVDGWLKLYLTLRGEKPEDMGRVMHLHNGKPRHGCVNNHIKV